MARGNSNDLRARAVAIVEDGESAREAGRLLNIGASTAIRWINRFTKTGSVAAKPGTGHSRSPLKQHEQWLLELVAKEPDLTLDEIRLRAAEQDRPDVAAARAELKAEQPILNARRLVFIDETAVTTKMVRHYGRSPRGKRLVGCVPHGHWKTLTLVAALRIDGLAATYVVRDLMIV
jgi:transposase